MRAESAARLDILILTSYYKFVMAGSKVFIGNNRHVSMILSLFLSAYILHEGRTDFGEDVHAYVPPSHRGDEGL